MLREMTPRSVRIHLFAAISLLLLMCSHGNALAQQPRLHLGAGVLPGAGVFASYSSPQLFVFTQEATLYADYRPTNADFGGRLLVSAGVGGSIQLTRLLELIRNDDTGPMGMDVGLRLGPSFFFAFNEQEAEEQARSFRVQFDPFVRGTIRTNRGTVFFAELGTTAPGLRGGIALGL